MTPPPPPQPQNTPLPLQHWETLRCELLWAFDAPLVSAACDFPYYCYPTAAWLLREGSLTLRFPDGGEERFSAGTWVFPKNTPGQQLFSEGAHLISIRYHAEWPTGQALFDRSRTVAFCESEAPDLTRAAARLAKTVEQAHLPQSENKQIVYPLVRLADFFTIQEPFSSWLRAVYETFVARGFQPISMGALHEPIRRCLDYLKRRDLSSRFRETELSREVGLSVSQINKLFAQQAQTTPKMFWNHRRVTVAQSQLIGSDQSIKSIAFSLGFQSSEAFSRWFHAQTGYRASSFRKLGQSGRTFHHSTVSALKRSRRALRH